MSWYKRARTLLARVSKSCQQLQAQPLFDISIAILIAVSVTLLFPEIALPQLDPTRLAIERIQEVISLFFFCELTIRYLAIGKARRFFREYWIDILAILPILHAFRVLRFLKLLRLFRVFRLFRIFGSKTRFLRRVTVYGGGEYVLLALFLTFSITLGALGLTWFEGAHSGYSAMEKSFWTAVFSTVSAQYSDNFPHTLGGKLTIISLELAGLCLFAVLTGTASVLLIEKIREGTGMNGLLLEELAGHVLVCGWNSGSAATLAHLQRHKDFHDKVFVVVADGEDFQGFHQLPDLTQVIRVREDFTRAEVLRKANVTEAAVALLFCDTSRGNSRQDGDARTVLAALTIDKLNPKLHSCAELANSGNQYHLSMAHIREVVVSQDFSGHLLAQAVVNSSNARLFRQLLKADNIQLISITEELAGRTFQDCVAQMAAQHGLVALALQDSLGQILINPGERHVGIGEVLLCLGVGGVSA